ncbi:MAG: AraC family transcriptional regulator [Myxococcota bacterium]
MRKPDVSAAPSDPLSDIAAASGLASGGILQRGLSGAFALALPAASHAVVHAVVRGKAVVAGVGDTPVELTEGQIAVLPHQTPHTIADAWPTRAEPAEEEQPDAGTIRNVGATAAVETVLLTLPFFLPGRGEPAAAKILPMLKVLRVPRPELVEMVLLISKLAMMPGPGDHYVACRIAEAALAKMLQQLAKSEEDRFGVFAVFASVGVKAALAAVRVDPARPWSVGELAEIAGMSRADFVAGFQDAVGTGVQDFLMTRRVRLAEALLKTGAATIDTLSDRVGFNSTASFRRAFERVTGHAPGENSHSWRLPRLLQRIPSA